MDLWVLKMMEGQVAELSEWSLHEALVQTGLLDTVLEEVQDLT